MTPVAVRSIGRPPARRRTPMDGRVITSCDLTLPLTKTRVHTGTKHDRYGTGPSTSHRGNSSRKMQFPEISPEICESLEIGRDACVEIRSFPVQCSVCSPRVDAVVLPPRFCNSEQMLKCTHQTASPGCQKEEPVVEQDWTKMP